MSGQGTETHKRLLGDKPAALKEGIIVAAKANQKPPAMQVNRGTNEQEMLGKLTNGTKYNTRKCIAKCELKDTSDHQQKSTEKDCWPAIRFFWLI